MPAERITRRKRLVAALGRVFEFPPIFFVVLNVEVTFYPNHRSVVFYELLLGILEGIKFRLLAKRQVDLLFAYNFFVAIFNINVNSLIKCSNLAL